MGQNDHNDVVDEAINRADENTQVAANTTHRSSNGTDHSEVVNNSAARHNQAHDFAGGDHNPDSLADLNSKINDLIATYGGVRDIGVGTLAQRPAAGTTNRFFWATDERILYRDNGSTWDPHASGFIPIYGESESESINASPDTWQQKLRVSVTPSVSAKYRISWYCEVYPNNSGQAAQFRVELDDTTEIGFGNVVHPYPADRYEAQSGFKIITLSAATHNIDIDWRSEWSYADDAYIRRARIEIVQVPE